jgi:hypothetical protein
MASISALNGFGGSFQYGSTTLCVNKWEVDNECDLLEITGTCSNSFKESIPGTKSLTFNVDAYLDTAKYPLPDLAAGQPVTSVKLNIGNSGDYHSIPAAWVKSFKMTNEAKAVVTFSVALEATGTFTLAS